MAVIFCAAMSSTAAELNALGSTTVVDFYRPLLRPDASDKHYLRVAKWLTAGWGIVAISFALFANLVENLIEAVNILGSIFYGTILGLFLAAFFLRFVRGTAVFVAALISQTMVLVLFYTTKIGYLWYNVIGCAAVCLFSVILQKTISSAPASALSSHVFAGDLFRTTTVRNISAPFSLREIPDRAPAAAGDRRRDRLLLS